MMLAAGGQLAGTLSMLFNTVAVILSDKGANARSMKCDAIDLRARCFRCLMAIAVDKDGQALLKIANVRQDAGVVDANNKNAFIAAP